MLQPESIHPPLTSLAQQIKNIVGSTLQSHTRPELPNALDAIGAPRAVDNPQVSKREYIESRLVQVTTEAQWLNIGRELLSSGENILPSQRFLLEELIWKATKTIEFSKKTRYVLAAALEKIELFQKSDAFINLIRRLWDPRDDSFLMEALGSSDRGTLIGEVRQHFIRHPEDWSVEELFDQIGAFTSSDYRFALFIESLASSEIRPEEGSQRGFVAAVNEGLKGSGIELREVGLEGGFPIFKFESTTRVIGRPKTVIFASLKKPDIRFTDLINSDIEALDEAGDVLAFDRSIPEKGLLWRDLQTWWSEKKGLSDSEAKKDLYNRLFRSLPSNSPTQRLIFDTYYRTFAPKVHQLPVLLPEVWLNWDPLSLRERGENALAFQRVDFLMFFSPATRVIIEADGRQHYANENGSVNPEAYAKLARMNREVRLAGYEIFRFGNAELHDSKIGRAIVADFFQRLFKRHHLVE